MKTTKFQLMQALFAQVPLPGYPELTIINSVSREDGSNHRFNVSGHVKSGRPIQLFIETVD